MDKVIESEKQFGIFREPFQAVSHLLGAFIGTATFVCLFSYSTLDPLRLSALLIYQITFISLFLASGLYHGRFHKSAEEEEFYEKLDYIGIYLFIAGSYTPICLQTLHSSLSVWILSIQWIAALIGSCMIFFLGIKARFLQTVIFLLMGWLFVMVAPSIFAAISIQNSILLIAGAAFYTVGAAIFAFAPKRVWRERVCTHSVWHLLVLGGAGSHLVLISNLIDLTD